MILHVAIFWGIRWNPSLQVKREECVLSIDLNRVDTDPLPKSLDMAPLLPPPPIKIKRQEIKPHVPLVASKVPLPPMPIKERAVTPDPPLIYKGFKNPLHTQLFHAPDPLEKEIPRMVGRVSKGMERPKGSFSLPVPRYQPTVFPYVEQSRELLDLPGSVIEGSGLDSYLAAIREKIERSKRYPYAVRRLNLQGKVGIVFKFGRDGRLIGPVRVRASSGIRILDQAAMDCVRRAAPFPPFPDGSVAKELVLSIDIKFRLKESL